MKRLIGLTGPSSFSGECMALIEKRLQANFVLLYHDDPKNLEYWIPQLSGVILAGGADIHPALYHQSVHNNKNLTKFDHRRDMRELFVLDQCFNRKLPVLGICRGHQLMAVYKNLGYDFIMDLCGDVCHQPNRVNVSLAQEEPSHLINFYSEIFAVDTSDKTARFYRVKDGNGRQSWHGYVNSFHHQGIRFKHHDHKVYAANEIQVLATAPTGLPKEWQTIIEAMRGTGRESHWITCQWHPEYDYNVNPVSAKVIDLYEEMLVKNEK